jgi:hypothetical protein
MGQFPSSVNNYGVFTGDPGATEQIIFVASKRIARQPRANVGAVYFREIKYFVTGTFGGNTYTINLVRLDKDTGAIIANSQIPIKTLQTSNFEGQYNYVPVETNDTNYCYGLTLIRSVGAGAATLNVDTFGVIE